METGANPKNISKIKDQYDDNNLGFVNYGQWLPCEGCPPDAITETGKLSLTDVNGLPVLNYPAGETIYLVLEDTDQNLNPAEADQVDVLIASVTETDGETIILTETAANSGIFTGSINTQLDAAIADDGLLQVTKGDKLTATYNDPADDFGNPVTITTFAFYDVTLLSGTINTHTTWTKANSPYLITGDVTVNQNVSLTIQPGVEVRIVPLSDDQNGGTDPNRSELIINGSLIANGLPNDSIRFLSNSENPAPGDWYGIRVNGPFSSISFNAFQHASRILYFRDYYSTNDTIQLTNNHFSQSGNGIFSEWYYQNFNIENNAFADLSGNAIYCYTNRGHLNIHNNIIDQVSYGIYIISHQNLTVKNSITNNTLNNVSNFGIGLNGVNFDKITNNQVHNSYYGIYAQHISGKILGNDIQYASDFGMVIDMSNILAENNLVKNNGSGIYVTTNFENPVTDTLRYNTITNNNYRGILNENYAKTVAQYNNIHDNGGYGQFDFENNSAFDLDARFNFWGDATTTEMETGANPKNISKIKDQYDDNNLGFVNYGQWADEGIGILNDEAELLSFQLQDQIEEPLINYDNNTIAVTVENNSNLTNLTACWTISENAVMTINGVVQECGITTNDYTNPVVFTITSEDGQTENNWTVNVTVFEYCTPDWTIVPNLQYNMQVIAQIYLADDVSLNPNDLVGAFVGDECRGIASPLVDFNGLVFLTVNSATLNGEEINLKIWNSELCESCEAQPSFIFENQTELGTLDEPIAVSCFTSVNLEIDLGAGYNWFSLNVSQENMHPNNIFADLTACDNDRIIGQTAFSVFTGEQWVGSLTSLSNEQMYRLKICEAQLLTVTGEPAELQPISINAGYTWLSYQAQSCLPINDALAELSPEPQANDRLIGQQAFAVYSGSSWIGSLTTLCPGDGYVIKLSNPSTLTYPVVQPNAMKSDAASQELESPIAIKPAKYLNHTMTIVAALRGADGSTYNDAANRVYAFINERCVGMANPQETENGLIFLNVGENTEDKQAVTFKVWLDDEKSLYNASETTDFVPLKGVGDFNQPFLITIGDKIDENTAWQIGSPYPNPFTAETILPVSLQQEATVKISIFTALGQLVQDPIEYKGQVGLNNYIIRGENLPQGTLHVLVEIHSPSNNWQKRMLLIHQY